MFTQVKLFFSFISMCIIEKEVKKYERAMIEVLENLYNDAKEIASLNVNDMSTEDLLEQYNFLLDSFDDIKSLEVKDYSKDFMVNTYDFVKNAENELKSRGYKQELVLANLYKEEIFR